MKFWPIFLTLNVIFSGLSWISILRKKWNENQKHKNVVQNIVNNLSQVTNQPNEPGFNNSTQNIALLNNVGMTAISLFLVIAISSCVAIPFFDYEGHIGRYAVLVMVERISEFMAKLGIPIIFYVVHNDFRRFVNKSIAKL